MKRSVSLLLCAAILCMCSLTLLNRSASAAKVAADNTVSAEPYTKQSDTQLVYQLQPDVRSAKPVSVSDFVDVPEGIWYYEALEILVKQGAINGMTQTSFCPDDTVTVEQFIKILVSCRLSDKQISMFDTGTETWSARYITAAQAMGTLTGFDLSQEHLIEPITRYEAAWLLSSFAIASGENLSVPDGIERAITDYISIPQELKTCVGLVFGAGLMAGYPDASFKGTDNLRRCEAVVTILRLQDKAKRIDVEIPLEQIYNYEQSVPESKAVEDNWFSDALFLGNSLCDGFALYSGLTQGTFKGKTSVTVSDVLSGERLSALQTNSYGKIYLMLGVNEIGSGTESVIDRYKAVVQQIKVLQPQAQIYVQALLPVCETMLSAAQRSYRITNSCICELNTALQKMCAEEMVYFVNVYETFADESGALPASKTWDGVHLQVGPYSDWLNYLKTHTVP